MGGGGFREIAVLLCGWGWGEGGEVTRQFGFSLGWRAHVRNVSLKNSIRWAIYIINSVGKNQYV